MTVTALTEDSDDYALTAWALGGISDKFLGYDIKFYWDGMEIQPNGYVKISIPIPDGYDREKLVMYHVTPDGELEEVSANIVGDMLVFETNHFSLYALAEADHTSGPNTNTGDNSSLLMLVSIVTLAGITVIAAVCAPRRNGGKN